MDICITHKDGLDNKILKNATVSIDFRTRIISIKSETGIAGYSFEAFKNSVARVDIA